MLPIVTLKLLRESPGAEMMKELSETLHEPKVQLQFQLAGI
jgi:hypothetical protein